MSNNANEGLVLIYDYIGECGFIVIENAIATVNEDIFNDMLDLLNNNGILFRQAEDSCNSLYMIYLQ